MCGSRLARVPGELFEHKVGRLARSVGCGSARSELARVAEWLAGWGPSPGAARSPTPAVGHMPHEAVGDISGTGEDARANRVRIGGCEAASRPDAVLPSSQVDFHPRRLGGLGASYRGHEGVRCWFAQLRHSRHEHRIVISQVQGVGEDWVPATGFLSLAGEPDISRVRAIRRSP